MRVRPRATTPTCCSTGTTRLRMPVPWKASTASTSSPVMRVKYAGMVSDFLDLAAGAGVRHVTYLSTYGSDQAPPEVDIRAVALDLACRGAFTHSILRPEWVMQNFSDEHVPVI